jgi:hypothetical protein
MGLKLEKEKTARAAAVDPQGDDFKLFAEQ